MSVPAIVVHGGAGRFTDERVPPARAGCRAAVQAGLVILEAGGTALAAAVAAVRMMEDDPVFNAGIGSVLTRDGIVEVDAAVAVGDGLRFGAIGAVPAIREPIELARLVMEDGEHTLLVGEAAWRFAREHGIEPCDPALLVTQRSLDRHAVEAERRAQGHAERIVDPEDPGTVGACAVDADGRVAAATSTGGITYKRAGRVGDTPVCGGGTFADDEGGAASATGHGESITRVTMARVCVDAMRRGATADEAAAEAVRELERIAGQGGIICCDRSGRLGLAHNSARMAWATGRAGDSADAVADGIGYPASQAK